MEEFSVVFMKRFRSNWFIKTKGRHVTYNTRQSVLRRKRIYASFVKSKIPKIFEVVYRYCVPAAKASRVDFPPELRVLSTGIFLQ
jgi:hypothetical protein